MSIAEVSWARPNDHSTTYSLHPPYRQVPDGLLFQYYLRHVSSTLATSDGSLDHAGPWLMDLWQTAIPAAAVTEQGTLHAVMALSALHMNVSNIHAGTSSLDYLATAELHYSMALADLRKSVEAQDQVSVDAILACCITLVPCSLAMACRSTAKTLSGDWVFHMRGFQALGEHLTSSQRPSETRQQLIRYPQPNNPGLDEPQLDSTYEQPSDSPSLLQDIRQSRRQTIQDLRRLVNLIPSSEDSEAHLEAIERLDVLFVFITEGRATNYTRATFHWIVKAPARFVQMLADMKTIALIVFAHWLVALLAMEEVWWWLSGFGAPGFASSRIQAIADVLVQGQSPHCHLLVWPIRMVERWGVLTPATRRSID